MVCHSGTSLVPIIDGKVYHFGPRGLYNGLVLLGDDETGSWWDHITGECVYGPSIGKRMEVLPVRHLTVREALARWEEVSVTLSIFSPEIQQKTEAMNKQRDNAQLPPGFTDTMGEADPRLPFMTSGVGLVGEATRRFYPVKEIRLQGGEVCDEFEGKRVRISLGSRELPVVEFPGSNRPSFYLFSRWYGFSYTYPGCEIYKG
ncbi:hypothetical protein GCM10011571_34540 [Marinithermofilum abyssi]|uniref:DUF3179 domain-containing protein n=1 Tax=Marinithermofilum abyssi TaxID=1571185 RepID=A0A8J2VFA9_9BACL|nr:hypothetical protein GCM10011571_34540 [Marinithermofilum abyssi]